VSEIVKDYRHRLPEILERTALPHNLPSAIESRKIVAIGTTSGPKKPMLVRAFKPLGYECKGESGTFTLRRKTATNLTAEVSLDVGTWSNSLTGFFQVYGVGFKARLPLPPSHDAIGSPQYPIGNATRWQQIVENLATLVVEFDRTFVAELEAASGPSPEWFKP
jgi:hypothetical protein